MHIYTIEDDTTSDYPGHLNRTIALTGCNFRCPTCHNKSVVNGKSCLNQEQVLDLIDKSLWFYNSVCISGGEPTNQPGLPDFLRQLKEKGLAVKLDTNGSNPGILKKVVGGGLVDYVAMDVKGPRELYPIVTGGFEEVGRIEESARFLSEQNPESYEFRTTIVPILRNDEISYITSSEAKKMAEWVYGITGKGDSKWYVQKFVARGGEIMDKRFSKEELGKVGLPTETRPDLLEDVRDSIGEYFPWCEVR